MENKTFAEMTVKELREESKKRGLTLESKGKKFKKEELIERILKHDAEQKDITDDIQKSIKEVEENEMWDASEVKTESVETKEVENKETKDETVFIKFAKTLEEIETKYKNRKNQNIYDNELKVGSFVVFVHYVEAQNGNVYKKLRTAKVVGVNRKLELVRVETLLGTEKELPFEELLYIRGTGDNCTYPKDIVSYLKKQRTEKGKVIINEKYTEGIITN